MAASPCRQIMLPRLTLLSMLTIATVLWTAVSFSLTTIVDAEPSCSERHFQCVAEGNCVPRSWQCDGTRDCNDGSDEDGDICKEGFDCPPDKFACKFLGQFMCARETRKCNGAMDCDDGIDEKNCTQLKTCSDNEFRCMDRGQCIRLALRCDGKRDCKDGSDEDSAACLNERSCPSGQFTCTSTLDGSATCMPRTYLCDSHMHCADGSDENGCGSNICDPGEFRCDSGQCISAQNLCDGNRDCQDGSDEDFTRCIVVLRTSCRSPPMRCLLRNGSVICIDEALKCDGRVDCKNGMDETSDCARFAFNCRGSFFRCDSRRCVPKQWRCDGDDDCFDGSDEKDCAGQE
ncbi:hypothetical protein MTO96_012285 [Rhipicephalus appendiculatus]